VSVGDGVDGALHAIEVSAEQALGSRGETGGIPTALYQWGSSHGLGYAVPERLKHLRKEPSFDSLSEQKGVGAVWWPPLTSGEVPIIVGLKREGEEFAVRIGLFRMEGNTPRAIGMRFESPHGNSNDHCFHHAQLWTHIRKGVDATRIVDPGAWVPEDQPSFPLPAKNPLELVWAAAVSIYGKANAIRPFEADPAKKKKITQYLTRIG
jgi:hypothetical protein